MQGGIAVFPFASVVFLFVFTFEFAFAVAEEALRVADDAGVTAGRPGPGARGGDSSLR